MMCDREGDNMKKIIFLIGLLSFFSVATFASAQEITPESLGKPFSILENTDQNFWVEFDGNLVSPNETIIVQPNKEIPVNLYYRNLPADRTYAVCIRNNPSDMSAWLPYLRTDQLFEPNYAADADHTKTLRNYSLEMVYPEKASLNFSMGGYIDVNGFHDEFGRGIVDTFSCLSYPTTKTTIPGAIYKLSFNMFINPLLSIYQDKKRIFEFELGVFPPHGEGIVFNNMRKNYKRFYLNFTSLEPENIYEDSFLKVERITGFEKNNILPLFLHIKAKTNETDYYSCDVSPEYNITNFDGKNFTHISGYYNEGPLGLFVGPTGVLGGGNIFDFVVRGDAQSRPNYLMNCNFYDKNPSYQTDAKLVHSFSTNILKPSNSLGVAIGDSSDIIAYAVISVGGIIVLAFLWRKFHKRAAVSAQPI